MTTTLEWAIFGVGLAAGLANTAGILASALGHSDYYPPGETDWTYYSLWGLSHALNAAILALAALQFQQLALPTPVIAVGVVLTVLGFVIAIAAGLDLGVERTSGLGGGLRTDGWYRVSRNPQYVGYIVATIGFPLVVGAPLTLPLLAIYMLWWLTFPFAEEEWLRGQYGDAYDAYSERVPRFVGRQTLRVLTGKGNRSPVDRQSDSD